MKAKIIEILGVCIEPELAEARADQILKLFKEQKSNIIKSNKMDNTPLVLVYPDKDQMPLSFAIDGHFIPEILAINENMLADILCEQIEDEISERDSCEDVIKNPNDYDLIYTVSREPFLFDVDIDFSTVVNPPGCVYPGRSVKIDDIRIEASWKGEMKIKWNKELLISSLEIMVHIAR